MGLFKLMKEAFNKLDAKYGPSKEKRGFSRLMSLLNLFPGTLKEYEQLVGYECEIVDTGERDKYVSWDWNSETGICHMPYHKQFEQKFSKLGIEAMIHFDTPYFHRGVPVRKKCSDSAEPER